MNNEDARLVRLRADASDDEILAVVRRWCDTLAAEDYEGALAMVLAPSWTADLLERTVAGYGDPESAEDQHKITPLESARYRPGDEPVNNPWPAHEVDRDTGGDGEEHISVWFDLPLDGYWSDLTATFDVDPLEGGLVLVLDMIHVM